MDITKALSEHLQLHGVTAPITGNRQPRSRDKDRIVTINQMPGGRGECEDMIQLMYVEVRARGNTHDMESAIELITEIDEILNDHTLWPFSLDGRICIQCRRQAGEPSFLHHDHESRATYRCTYALRVASHA